MKKKVKLKACNWTLLVSTVAILVSGIDLEVSNCSDRHDVWVHVFLGTLFILATYHVYLHFGRSNWFSRFMKLKRPPVRILWWLYIFTAVSGVIATIHLPVNMQHSPIGGVHGKIGFLMILFSIFHIAKRIKFFSK